MSQFVTGPMASAIAAGLVLAAPTAAAQETASAECTDQAAGAANSKSAAAPQADSHDLRTNVVARTGGAASACAADHAISIKGTGAAGRSAGGGDCNDLDCDAEADDAASAAKEAPKASCIKVTASQNTQSLRSSMAINTKGTGAYSGKAAAVPGGTLPGPGVEAAAGKYSAPINVTATCTIK